MAENAGDGDIQWLISQGAAPLQLETDDDLGGADATASLLSALSSAPDLRATLASALAEARLECNTLERDWQIRSEAVPSILREAYSDARRRLDALDAVEEEISDLAWSISSQLGQYGASKARWRGDAEALQSLTRALAYLDCCSELHAFTDLPPSREALYRIAKLRSTAQKSFAGTELLGRVNEVHQQCYSSVFQELSRSMEDALQSVGWPGVLPHWPLKPHEEEAMAELAEHCCRLIKFAEGDSPEKRLKPLMDVAVRPLALSFRYHFEGKRPTNRIDKPEWFLAHVHKTLSTTRDFVQRALQPILDAEGGGVDAGHAFVTAYLEACVRHKVLHDAPLLVQTPELLAHLARQLLQFDSNLKAEGYEFREGFASGVGTSVFILREEKWLGTWLSFEGDYARKQLAALFADPQALGVFVSGDEDEDDAEDPRATVFAQSLLAQLDTLDALLRLVPSASTRRLFVETVCVPTLQDFLSRVGVLHRAQSGLSFAAGRDVSADQLLAICGAVSTVRAAEQLVRQGWLDDPFYIELYYGDADENVLEEDDNALLRWCERAAEECRRLLDILNDLVLQQWTVHAKPYEKGSWTAQGAAAAASVSILLAQPLTILGVQRQLLESHLPTPLFARASLRLAERLEHWWYERVVLRHRFSMEGAQQLQHDFCEGGRATRAWSIDAKTARTPAALTLLSASAKIIADVHARGVAAVRERLPGIASLDADTVEEIVERRTDVEPLESQ